MAPPWLKKCQGKKGPLANVFNARVALEHDPTTQHLLGFDEMMQTTVLFHEIGMPDLVLPVPRPLQDIDVIRLQLWMQESGLMTMGDSCVRSAVDEVARGNSYHPLRNYLECLEWDGVKRINVWMISKLGCKPSPYVQRIGEMFLISMVARVMQPGCKADYMVILESPQGEMKSLACRTLAEPWFSDSLPDISASAKDASLHLRGKWLVEISEMHAFNKAEASHLKSFISRQEERYRPPYGHLDIVEPRQCVFIGTTNKDIYLLDETGNRRFWPIRIGAMFAIDIDGLRKDRDQLFAEALLAFREGRPWWPDADFEAREIRPQQDNRYDEDAWIEKAAPFLKVAAYATVGDVAREALHIPTERLGRREQNRIINILKNLGWKSGPRGPHGERRYYPSSYEPTPD